MSPERADIVDWLRRFKTLLIKSDASKPEGVAVARIAEAADEIERLRTEMESGNYLTEHDKLSLGIERQALEIKDLQNEIKRLRSQVALLRGALASSDPVWKAKLIKDALREAP